MPGWDVVQTTSYNGIETNRRTRDTAGIITHALSYDVSDEFYALKLASPSACSMLEETDGIRDVKTHMKGAQYENRYSTIHLDSDHVPAPLDFGLPLCTCRQLQVLDSLTNVPARTSSAGGSKALCAGAHAAGRVPTMLPKFDTRRTKARMAALLAMDARTFLLSPVLVVGALSSDGRNSAGS